MDGLNWSFNKNGHLCGWLAQYKIICHLYFNALHIYVSLKNYTFQQHFNALRFTREEWVEKTCEIVILVPNPFYEISS